MRWWVWLQFGRRTLVLLRQVPEPSGIVTPWLMSFMAADRGTEPKCTKGPCRGLGRAGVPSCTRPLCDLLSRDPGVLNLDPSSLRPRSLCFLNLTESQASSTPKPQRQTHNTFCLFIHSFSQKTPQANPPWSLGFMVPHPNDTCLVIQTRRKFS